MKIALLGYGKMGKAIEEIALERNHEIVLKINSTNLQDLNAENISKADTAIEFSKPSSAVANIELCLENNIPVAVGTTGWYDSYELVKSKCDENKGSLLTATNFSIGVNLFFELSRKFAQLMSSREEYKAEIEEIHHTQKLDSPSGTAITLAENVINNHAIYNKWENETSDQSTLGIISKREPEVPGTHELTFESSIDKISLRHEAKNRKGFALGAVLAAEYIYNKDGIFTMQDVLNN